MFEIELELTVDEARDPTIYQDAIQRASVIGTTLSEVFYAASAFFLKAGNDRIYVSGVNLQEPYDLDNPIFTLDIFYTVN